MNLSSSFCGSHLRSLLLEVLIHDMSLKHTPVGLHKNHRFPYFNLDVRTVPPIIATLYTLNVGVRNAPATHYQMDMVIRQGNVPVFKLVYVRLRHHIKNKSTLTKIELILGE